MFGLTVAPVLAVVKPFWKPIAIVVAVGAAWWAFSIWRDHLVSAAEEKGFARAEEQYTAQIAAANKIAERDDINMKLMASALGGLSQQREQKIDLTVKPQIERIQNEVASDPRYRDCRVSDGVLDAANAARAAVDAGIAASNPRRD